MSGRLLIIFSMMFAFVGRTHADQFDFERKIKPLLAEKCGACHSALKSEAGLRLDAGTLVRKGGDDGPVLTPGKPGESELIRRVSSKDDDERMPPADAGSPLTQPQIELLSDWIRAGAVVPANEEIPADPRKHWAYQPPVRGEPPNVNPLWSHPVDAFIAREHRRLDLRAVELADRHTRLRRLYMNLIGLPPSREQVRQFVEDESEEAWSRVVDELLSSPHYGERWGRRWMDVWRYSDWDGYKQQLRGSQRHIWRWRDWIVKSLNDDKGYDRMVVEMLAGDELAPDDASVLPATGFLARNFHKSNRNIWLDSAVEHTSKAFLGMTLNCARCHDHKYDPLSQQAYYQFRAIFETHSVRIDRVPGQSDLMKDGVARAFDSDLATETFLYLRGNDKHPDKDHPMSPAIPAVLGGQYEVKPVELPLVAHAPELREFVVKEQLAAAKKRLTTAEQARAKLNKPQADEESERLDLNLEVARLEVESLQARQAAERAKLSVQKDAASLAETAAKSERLLAERQAERSLRQAKMKLLKAAADHEKNPKKNMPLLVNAKKALAAAQKKQKEAKAALEKKDASYTPLGKQYPRTSSGRRLALARWIVDERNPLTARVAVNHIWLRHFGSPLVENVFDFGLRSPRPPHADLLDWLAVELMENGWSMKHVHRLIVTSRAWQLASSAAGSPFAEKNSSIDPDNRYLWKTAVQRLDAEIVRDNLLAVGQQLDKSMGGADIDFRKGEESLRRSIYLRHAYEKQMTMLLLFDAASPLECYRRSESIIPQQALALSNSGMSLGISRSLAGRLWSEASKDPEGAEERFVEIAFLQVLSRPPTTKEQAACLKFLEAQANTLTDTAKLRTFPGGRAPKVKPSADPRQRARENLTHVLMNHNDFVSVR